MAEEQNILSSYSVINTNLRIKSIDGNKFIEKHIQPNISLPCSIQQLKAFVDKYILEIKSTGVPLPEIRESYITNDKLIYVCNFEGPNIIEAFSVYQLWDGEGYEALKQIINVLSLAKQHGCFLDPHPKNFVWNGEKVHYVDFSPPYIKEFMEMRISLANNEELPIVEKNLSYFSPENLFYHFAGDFLNINQKLPEDFLMNLYRQLISAKAIKTSYSNFINRAKKIRELEDLRLKKKIYLF